MLVGIDVLDVVRMEKFIQNERFLNTNKKLVKN